MRGALLGVLLMLLLASPAAAREPEVSSAAEVRLKEGIRRAVARHRPARGTFGIHVRLARSGEAVCAVDAAAARIPASTMKLVTTASALLELGPEYRFRTRILARERSGADGWRGGDLLVVGGGDPTISEGKGGGGLSELVAGLARSSALRVRGKLILDAGKFDSVLRHPDWPRDQLSRSYCAPVAGLSVNRGCVTVVVRPGSSPGAPAVLVLEPDPRNVAIDNRIVTTAKRREHRIILEMVAARGGILCRGKVWTGSTGYRTEVSLPDPVASFGEILRRLILDRGGSVGAVSKRPGFFDSVDHPWLVVADRSTPLLDVLTIANRESQNHYAECLLKTLGHEKTGEGSFGAGAAVTAGLADRLRVTESGFVQVDGSGMSRANRLAPSFLTGVLTLVFRSSHGKLFVETLAVGGGSDGTLSRRLKDLGGEVRAKTGTLRAVSALAGYVRSKRGVAYCFAVLINDPKTPLSRARSLQDEICRVLFREG